jgi:hypothetical protein
MTLSLKSAGTNKNPIPTAEKINMEKLKKNAERKLTSPDREV